MKKKIISTFAVRLLSTLLSMGAGILIARILGPAGRGEYFLSITILGMVQQFGALGLHSSNVYLVAGNRELYPKLAANSLLISLAVGVAAFPILLAILPHQFSSIDYVMAGLIALAVGPSLYYLMMSNLLLGADRVKEFNWFELLSRLLPLLLIGIFIFFTDVDVHLAVLSSVLAMLVSVIVMAYFASPRQFPKMDISLFKGGVSYGLRAYLAAMLVFLLSRAGGVLLGLRDSAVEMGHLSIALQLADFMSMLPATIGLVLFPRLVESSEGRGSLTFKVAKAVAGLMLGACIAAGVLADPLIPLVFGDDFGKSIRVFRLMLPGIFALSLITVISQYLAAHGIPWGLVTSWILGLLIMVAISWSYIPEQGANAVAIAMSVSYGAVFALLSLLAIRNKFVTSRKP